MAITLNLVKLMNGTITVVSEESHGTHITVTLPLPKVEFEEDSKPQINDDTPDFTGKRILIAEDNDINCAVIDAILRPTNAELIFVENGQLAINAVENNRFDLVLMDIHMPVMDGKEAFVKIREMQETVPVIALTANALKGEKEKCISAGMNDYLSKPIDGVELFEKCRQWLGEAS